MIGLLDLPEDVPHQHWLRGKNMNRIYNNPVRYPKEPTVLNVHTFAGGTKSTTWENAELSMLFERKWSNFDCDRSPCHHFRRLFKLGGTKDTKRLLCNSMIAMVWTIAHNIKRQTRKRLLCNLMIAKVWTILHNIHDTKEENGNTLDCRSYVTFLLDYSQYYTFVCIIWPLVRRLVAFVSGSGFARLWRNTISCVICRVFLRTNYSTWILIIGLRFRGSFWR